MSPTPAKRPNAMLMGMTYEKRSSPTLPLTTLKAKCAAGRARAAAHATRDAIRRPHKTPTTKTTMNGATSVAVTELHRRPSSSSVTECRMSLPVSIGEPCGGSVRADVNAELRMQATHLSRVSLRPHAYYAEMGSARFSSPRPSLEGGNGT